MSQGMFTAVSGIRANQTRLNVISNNVANVNTLGFKSSSANFATVFASTLSGGSAPNGILGGTNPRQIGNGALVSEIASNFGQGGTQFTGRNTDLSINGDGFFAVERVDTNNGNNSTDYYLTRAGNFTLDSNGNLVTASGNRLRGSSQISGSSTATLGRIQVPTEFQITKELDADGKVQNVFYSPIGRSAANIATDYAAAFGAPPVGNSLSTVTVQLRSFSVGTDGSISATYSNGDQISVRTDSASVTAANAAGDPTLVRREIVHRPYEGGSYPASTYSATDNPYGGQVAQATGQEVFTSGITPTPAGVNPMEGMQMQLQTASVINPAGLLYDGNNNFLQSANSGQTQFGVAGSGSRGNINAGALESSNVDLAGEFTNMIVSQRGLEAASKVVRAQSEVMQTIIQIV
ncbi:flagellar hook-basal body complex protein [Vampirovibrio chlorellavorus]|uniref:flagellar hook-basal body complex protein n=1 Tax=Vampirovibrio chlorellavorus TaxID=758823 RepID=UPI0026F36F73|nr:flagellar hook-basal body complex protein [Vampirovibrio chlorellavorus]